MNIQKLITRIVWIVGIIFVVMAIITAIKYVSRAHLADKQATKNAGTGHQPNTNGSGKTLEFVEAFEVSPGRPYTTPYINYRFKILGTAHGYLIQYTVQKPNEKQPHFGEYLTRDPDPRIPYGKPEYAVPGSLRISAKPGETHTFTGELYRVIKGC